MNEITRPIAYNLGFDEHGQLWVQWDKDGGTCATIIADMRGLKCPICGNGWELSAEAFRNQYRSQVTDEWYHETCYIGHLGMSEATMWHTALCYPEPREAFIPIRGFKKIPNEYGGSWNTPWYRIDYDGYVPWAKVGARKRVYHMSLHDLRPEQVAAFDPLFKDEDVTKSTGPSQVMIHAHGNVKVKEYLVKFATIIKMDKPKEGSRAAELLAEAKT